MLCLCDLSSYIFKHFPEATWSIVDGISSPGKSIVPLIKNDKLQFACYE